MKKGKHLLAIAIGTITVLGCDSSDDEKSVSEEMSALSRPISSTVVNVFTDVIALSDMAPQIAAANSSNLLHNPGFELGRDGWSDCQPNSSNLSADAHSGEMALALDKKKCVYRSVEASAGSSYVLSCYVKLISEMAWTGMGMAISNRNHESLVQAPVAVATSGEYVRLDTMATAPPGTSFISMWLYSDHGALVDDCSLSLTSDQPPIKSVNAANLLSNGDFATLNNQSGAAHWSIGCGGTALADGSSLYIADNACAEQALGTDSVSKIRSNKATFSCLVTEVIGDADLRVYLDDKIVGVRKITPELKNTRVKLEIDGTSASNGFVALYAKNHLQVDDCVLSLNGYNTESNVDSGTSTDSDTGVSTSINAFTLGNEPLEKFLRNSPSRGGGLTLPDVPLTQEELSKLKWLIDFDGSHSNPRADDGIVSLVGLEYAVNLETIRLTVNRGITTDLAPLAGLTKLTSIQMRGTITDLSPLAGLTLLTDLELNISTSDLSPLSGLTSLTTLKLSGPISDISALASLTSLTTLELSGPISDISALASLNSLTKLYLYPEHSFSDLSPMASLTSLDWLVVGRSSISDLNPIGNLPRLREIDIQGKIADASPIASLPKLEKLFFKGNPLSNIEALAAGTALNENDVLQLDIEGINQSDLIALNKLIDRGVSVRLINSNGDRVPLPEVDAGASTGTETMH